MHCVRCYDVHDLKHFCPRCLAYLRRQRDIENGLVLGARDPFLWSIVILGACEFCRRYPCQCRCNICGKLHEYCRCSASAILAYYGEK